MPATYVVGIDLGTTNSVVAYTRLDVEDPAIELLSIPQLVAPGVIESRLSLPSFLFIAPSADSAYDLPWKSGHDFVVGEMARRQSAEMPERTVGGAKSWLCHGKVDRYQPILPWNAPAEVKKVSPVLATQRFLEHMIAAWEHTHPDAPISEQRVVVTVPASFDPGARELTREAAVSAGLPENFVLLEEPQAAVYSWLLQMGPRWRKTLKVGDSILVVDVGGGTTDLTLVSVSEEQGELQLKRVAVGNHLLVGGDNMDLALAYKAAELFQEKGTALDPWQSVSLWHSCRGAKETLLAEGGPETQSLSVLGRGRKLVGGTISIDLERTVVEEMILDGFLPRCGIGEQPSRRRGSGFQEIGLPFEADTAITRHLAQFLSQNGDDEHGPIRPTDLLVNGGVFKSPALQDRLISVMEEWFPSHAPRKLAGERELDHAVAKGAAFYGWSKVKGGVRIRGGVPRSYYIGIETAGLAIPGAPRPLRALCVVPRGMEEGTEHDVPSGEVGLIVGEPTSFRFLSSSVRKEDQPGDLVPSWTPEEISEIDPLEATLPADDDQQGHYVPVKFHARVTELGMLELWCVSLKGDQRWKLEFNVREEE